MTARITLLIQVFFVAGKYYFSPQKKLRFKIATISVTNVFYLQCLEGMAKAFTEFLEPLDFHVVSRLLIWLTAKNVLLSS